MKPTLLDMHAAKGDGGGGGGEWLHKTKTQSGCQNHLELRLGVSPNNTGSKHHDNSFADPVPAASTEAKGGATVGPELRFRTTLGGFIPSGGTSRWLSESAVGFIHPWSLAARQQKAAFEQAHHLSKPSSSSVPRFTAPPPPPVVGWPPVRACRRNLVPTKPEMDGEKDAKRSKVTTEDEQKSTTEVKPTLFVKVNMEGLAVGRKINLKAHDSYDSLSRALQKMFNNFLCANYSTDATEEEQDDTPSGDYILLYEDHEGDRMLVGDVPWQMFITTVKRLYIANNPKKGKHDNGNGVADNGKGLPGNGKAADGGVEQ